jgi:predicted nuclease of predicted toxin-antitoxin system
MGVSLRVVDWLRQSGHDAKHLREEHLQTLPNGEIFQKAVRENRVVLTFDLDFGEIVALSKGKRTGVILFRLQNTRAEHVIKRLAALFSDSALSFENRVVIVEESRYRIRQFPD